MRTAWSSSPEIVLWNKSKNPFLWDKTAESHMSDFGTGTLLGIQPHLVSPSKPPREILQFYPMAIHHVQVFLILENFSKLMSKR